MKADSTTEAAVIAVLNRFGEAYASRDIDGIMSILSPDPDLFLYGTGADEKRIGPAEFRIQAERDWAQTETASFEFGEHTVSAAGSVAWVATEGAFRGRISGEEVTVPVRLTCVMENRQNQWLIAQAHFSVAHAEQEEGESFPSP
ncbi:MAG: nuclear transport factor 2 family protein [Dehalococcoidia bacterium]